MLPDSSNAFIGGVFYGAAETLVGHPFDTIKVRMQTSEKRFKGPLDAAMVTYKNEKLNGFYKGCTPSMLSWIIMDSITLGSLHQYRYFLKQNFYNDYKTLPLFGHCIAGAMSGWTVSIISAPLEQIKSRLQIQYDSHSKKFTGPIDCATTIYKLKGLKGLYSGLPSTLLFRSASAAWWGSYESFKNYFNNNTNLSTISINFWAGGLSSIVFWSVGYPADVIRQIIMTDNIQNPVFKNNILNVVKYVYKNRGIMGFFKGFGPSILRSFPANAAGITAFEFVMKYL
ncbi:mitochondrial carrier [Ascoidea rubescens DSM 1968]|uniref:Mitochondrial carrier n=1 Tax=Ascoidea rubescens DSM 1968 TaxID=1344418 RepID=A0A1D2VJH3_9ASCO|nr:mitochondrial carrier [Ascoidea rubescens DSM 1968]ODV61768.1 mitochondrial carrier [Ascoidea rubescens DSM 1968]